MKEVLIGCVGKPSAGKSTFFNSIAERTSAKMGAYPFTTIEANSGVTFYMSPCPCSGSGLTCSPNEGVCENGTRKIPVKLLDIAGLIPNAHMGEGLGNKFLDDIRTADVLLHIIDISGTTDAKGNPTDCYDPSRDHLWLMSEIKAWIFNNLWEHWPSIIRKCNSGVDYLNILHDKLSGYQCKIGMVQATLEKCGHFGSVDYSLWTKDDVQRLCESFVDVRFPTVLVLNKCEKDSGAADRHIAKLTKLFPTTPVIMASAKSELFLRKLQDEKLIDYNRLTGELKLNKDLPAEFKDELDFIQGFVLKRCGTAGSQQAIQQAIELTDRVVVYPISNLTTIRNGKGTSFENTILVPKSMTIRDICCSKLHEESLIGVIGETIDGNRFGGDDAVSAMASPRVIRLTVNGKCIF